jgi:hypothetical protein
MPCGNAEERSLMEDIDGKLLAALLAMLEEHKYRMDIEEPEGLRGSTNPAEVLIHSVLPEAKVTPLPGGIVEMLKVYIRARYPDDAAAMLARLEGDTPTDNAMEGI